VAANAREYASDVTGVVVPSCGHWLYEERPSELAQMLRDFLEAARPGGGVVSPEVGSSCRCAPSGNTAIADV
jgi:hypothetical protein